MVKQYNEIPVSRPPRNRLYRVPLSALCGKDFCSAPLAVEFRMPQAPKPLAGKTALITGAARRLGRASALALAQAGADVAITFRNSARDARETVVDLCGLG